jgi:hypothetical protein
VAYREALDRGRSLTEIDSGLDQLVSALMAGLFKKVEEQAYATGGRF